MRSIFSMARWWFKVKMSMTLRENAPADRCGSSRTFPQGHNNDRRKITGNVGEVKHKVK